ncbi:MAG: hypothetical protein R3A47_02600 [Polyangiales bacterium]
MVGSRPNAFACDHQEAFENQRQTVMEERRQRIDNQPYVPSMLRINELAYGDYFAITRTRPSATMRDLQQAPLKAVPTVLRPILRTEQRCFEYRG